MVIKVEKSVTFCPFLLSVYELDRLGTGLFFRHLDMAIILFLLYDSYTDLFLILAAVVIMSVLLKCIELGKWKYGDYVICVSLQPSYRLTSLALDPITRVKIATVDRKR